MMRYFSGAAVLLQLFTTFLNAYRTLGAFSHLKPFIVNGQVVPDLEITFAASIRIGDSDSNHCTGSVIAPQYIITAAHCNNPFNPLKTAIVGTHDVSDPSESNIFEIEWVKVHPSYITNEFPVYNEISVVKLVRPIDLPNVKPVSLSRSKELEVSGASGTIAGWGEISQVTANTYTDLLLLATNEILSTADCNTEINAALDRLTDEQLAYEESMDLRDLTDLGSSFLCSKAVNNAMGTPGDSGGPLFRKVGDDDVLIGAMIGGINNVSYGFPTFFPSIADSYEFIEQYSEGHSWYVTGEEPKDSSTPDSTITEPESTSDPISTTNPIIPEDPSATEDLNTVEPNKTNDPDSTTTTAGPDATKEPESTQSGPSGTPAPGTTDEPSAPSPSGTSADDSLNGNDNSLAPTCSKISPFIFSLLVLVGINL